MEAPPRFELGRKAFAAYSLDLLQHSKARHEKVQKPHNQAVLEHFSSNAYCSLSNLKFAYFFEVC